ncbi:hypothetical protein RN001_006979 [Aquatica leii]|uniref:Cytochrome c oxidase assembly protein COX16 homolog, mitochondrial n=1 Tax=Aquatica leii TaxID=1421715 RepID=A0AAN7P902_9COLE|nr:hypothetical protein RN001_006979 [Aquatica leii]
MFSNLKIKFRSNRKFVKLGLPLVVLVVGGSFYLEQFSKIRYKFGRQQNLLHPDELKKQGLETKKREEITLEAEYEKLKSVNIDNWEQVRIPRPWDKNVDS